MSCLSCSETGSVPCGWVALLTAALQALSTTIRHAGHRASEPDKQRHFSFCLSMTLAQPCTRRALVRWRADYDVCAPANAQTTLEHTHCLDSPVPGHRPRPRPMGAPCTQCRPSCLSLSLPADHLHHRSGTNHVISPSSSPAEPKPRDRHTTLFMLGFRLRNSSELWRVPKMKLHELVDYGRVGDTQCDNDSDLHRRKRGTPFHEHSTLSFFFPSTQLTRMRSASGSACL